MLMSAILYPRHPLNTEFDRVGLFFNDLWADHVKRTEAQGGCPEQKRSLHPIAQVDGLHIKAGRQIKLQQFQSHCPLLRSQPAKRAASQLQSMPHNLQNQRNPFSQKLSITCYFFSASVSSSLFPFWLSSRNSFIRSVKDVPSTTSNFFLSSCILFASIIRAFTAAQEAHHHFTGRRPHEAILIATHGCQRHLNVGILVQRVPAQAACIKSSSKTSNSPCISKHSSNSSNLGCDASTSPPFLLAAPMPCRLCLGWITSTKNTRKKCNLLTSKG